MNLNPVTVFALLAWPLIALWLYQTRPIGVATVWTFLGAYLLLPVGANIKFPMIPQFDKSSIPTFAALLGCLVVKQRPIRLGHGFGLPEALMLLLLVGSFVTSVLNEDQIIIGRTVLESLGPYDGVSAAFAQFTAILPFIIGRQVLRSSADIEGILKALVITGLVYSLPILLEIRLSPQLHTWIYGYFPHTMFDQQIRDGGYRPVVFLGHGLVVAFFVVTTAVAAAAFWRSRRNVFRSVRLSGAGVTGYLSLILVLCKTGSALAYGIFLVPLVRLTGPKLQLRVACLLVTLALAYPALRAANLIPTEALINIAASFSRDREGSLQTRFFEEGKLLDRASQRLYFGWGRAGRERIYDNNGYDVTLPDGYWIITIGQFGVIGFAAIFGLLSLGVFRAASALRFVRDNSEAIFLAALGLIVAINMFDLLPNSSISPWTWLMTGALFGRAEELRSVARRRVTADLVSTSRNQAVASSQPTLSPEYQPRRY